MLHLFTYLAAAAAVFKALLLPVEFKDLKFTCTEEQIAGLAQDAADYFNKQFQQSESCSFQVGPTFSSAESYIKYGANSTSATDALFYSIASQACRNADKDIDFSKVDLILLLVPGQNESDSGDENLFWPQASSLSAHSSEITLDGKVVDKYAIFSELGPDGLFTGIGDLCHETGHLLGLPDFYDTDGDRSRGLSEGLCGENALMDKGNRRDNGHNPPDLTVLERFLLDMNETIEGECGSWSLRPMQEGGNIIRVQSDTSGRFCLIGNDGSKKLSIMLVDRSESKAGWSSYYKKELTAAQRWEYNEINCNPDNLCARTVGNLTGRLAVTDVREEAGAISLRIVEPIIFGKCTTLQDAAFICWKSGLDESAIASASCTLQKATGEACGDPVILSQKSGGRFLLDGLEAATAYQATISVSCRGGETYSLKTEFTTRSFQGGLPPFIIFLDAERNADGSFVKGTAFTARVFNAVDAVSTTWLFDGKEVKADSTGRWAPEKDGTLDAIIDYKDGSRETIRKRIILR